jgi:carbon-monoxide dehydrogenase medium subunit
VVRLAEPGTLGEAIGLARAEPESKFVAGGTAVVLLLQQHLIDPAVLISLRGVRDAPWMRAVTLTGGTLEVGGGVSLTEIAGSGLVREHAPSLARAAGVVGNLRVRNAATVGGNVAEADYASDPLPVLVNLGAEFVVHGADGSRVITAAGMFVDYFTTALRPDEVITSVRIPVAGEPARTTYVKFSSRSLEDRPCVGVAASLRAPGGVVDSVDVVVGAVAGVPQRFPDVLSEALGEQLADARVSRLADEYAARADAIDDLRGSAWYRREMVRVFVRRALSELRSDCERAGA